MQDHFYSTIYNHQQKEQRPDQFSVDIYILNISEKQISLMPRKESYETS